MSKKGNSFLIGIFVIGATFLLLAGVVLFGSGEFFVEKLQAISFFDGSVKGLQVGASVTFKGVKIGRVEDVRIELIRKDDTLRIPVIMTIFPGQVSQVGELTEGDQIDSKEALQNLIDRGLRAQLEMESFVTGVLSVNLDFIPNSPKKLIGALPGYVEIPTIPSTLEYLSSLLDDLPVSEIVNNVRSILKNVKNVLKSKDGKQLAAKLDESLDEFSETLAAGRQLINKVDGKVDPISSDVHSVLSQLTETLNKAENTFTNANELVNSNSEIGDDVRKLVDELRGASYKVKNLADYLERNPEAFIRGKR